MDQEASALLTGLTVWAILAVVWLALTVIALKGLRRAQGRAGRVGLFVLCAVMVAVLAAPLGFYAVMLLASVGSSAPEAGAGAGGAALIAGLVMGVISGVVIAGIAAVWLRAGQASAERGHS